MEKELIYHAESDCYLFDYFTNDICNSLAECVGHVPEHVEEAKRRGIIKTSEIIVQSDVPPPTFFEPEPVKKTRKKAEPKQVDQVLENLKMLGLITKKKGTVQETHIEIREGFATASLNELTVGCPFPFSANSIVNHNDLLEAKKVCGNEFSCTDLSGQIVIVADELRLIVATDHSGVWACPQPDAPIAPATDELRRALIDVAPFSTNDRPDIQGVLCQAYTTVATNGHVLLESWHGVDMPPHLRLPVSFIKKLEKIKRSIKQFGFSDHSFTVWFEDGSFIRTAMYKGKYAAYSHVFEDTDEFDLVDLPEEFYKTLKSLVAFAKDGVVYFKDGRIYTAKNAEAASSFQHQAIPDGFGFNVNYLLLIAKHAPSVKFMHSREKIQFECGNVRGAVMGIDMRPPQKIAEAEVDPEYNDYWDDDVPF